MHCSIPWLGLVLKQLGISTQYRGTNLAYLSFLWQSGIRRVFFDHDEPWTAWTEPGIVRGASFE